MDKGYGASLRVCGLSLGSMLFIGCACGQGITGRWVTYGKELWNGQREQAVIVLNKQGSQISGTFESLTGKTNIHGTMVGKHFEIFAWDQRTLEMWLTKN